jgi:hypothetical protein
MKEAMQNDRQSRENLRKVKSEMRTLETTIAEKETDIQTMHLKYEELLGQKDKQLAEVRTQFN